MNFRYFKVGLILSIIDSIACACGAGEYKRSEPKLIRYELTLIKPIQDRYTQLPLQSERKDTIMALNDTIAYQKALIMFYGTTYSNQPYIKEFLSQLRSPKRFSIKAPDGQFIENKLSDTLKRRLDRYIKGIAEKALADAQF